VVFVEGRPKFHATPGKYKGRKAFQVVKNIEEHALPPTTVPANEPEPT
jgi:flagellar motor switch protein FliM